MALTRAVFQWSCFLVIFPLAPLTAAGPCGGGDELPPPPQRIVYTSMAIDDALNPIDQVISELKTFEDNSPHQQLSEVGWVNDSFGISDVIMKTFDPDGGPDVEETIFQCTGVEYGFVCAAHEARVSPDASKIAFSVSFGLKEVPYNVPNIAEVKRSAIYIYDIEDGGPAQVIADTNQPGLITRMPDWIDNNTLVYASNEQGLWPVRIPMRCHDLWDSSGNGAAPDKCPTAQDYGTRSLPAFMSMQIWRMTLDDSGAVIDKRNLTPHETMAIRPTVLRHENNKGRIAYSSLQIAEDSTFEKNGAGPNTIKNMWWLMTIAADGTAPAALFGAHGGNKTIIYKDANREFPNIKDSESVMALRTVGEDTNGRLYFTNYYRGNNMGLGSVYSMSVYDGEFGVEGCSLWSCYQEGLPGAFGDKLGSGRYIPPDLRSVTPFAHAPDNALNYNADKTKSLGTAGYPSYLDGGGVLATWGKGWCSNDKWQLPGSPFNGTKASIGIASDDPVCNLEVVQVLNGRVTDPFSATQLRVLTGDNRRHEFDAVEVVARPAVPVPDDPLDTGCYLQVVDLSKAELDPATPQGKVPFDGIRRWDLVATQGHTVKPHRDGPADTGDLGDNSFHSMHVQGLALYRVEAHTGTIGDPTFDNAVNYTGYKDVSLMGEVPMRGDGSIKVKVPCDQPFTMSAVDETGMWITHDPMAHSLRPGEVRTCHGCHDGHSVERHDVLKLEGTALERFELTNASSWSPIPELNGEERVTFADIEPILQSSCGGACHSEFNASSSLLWSSVFAGFSKDFASSAAADRWMPQLIDKDGTVMDERRPYFSQLVARYARWSPLVWYLENDRLDGYDNALFPLDRDYNENHPDVTVSDEEIRKVVDYIQLGAPKPLPN